MKIKNGREEEYENIFVKRSSGHFYSMMVVRFVERWADLMESAIKSGKSIPEIAKETSNEADTESISGFQYGCAVSALSEFWEYGDELRKWHNAKYHYDGDGVIDPAFFIMDIGDRT